MDIKVREENPKIFVVSGKARSGKDKVSSFIKSELEKESKRVINLQFAYYIKNYAINISDWDGKDETKPRTFLQYLGTDIIRNKIDDEFFIRRMIDDIKVYSYFFDAIVISDARFVKEIEMIRRNFKDVVSINVVRPLYISELTDDEKKHATETGLLGYTDFDYEILNNGSSSPMVMSSFLRRNSLSISFDLRI